jgi:hypothetical protein
VSIQREDDLSCACGAMHRVRVVDSINAGRHPHLRDAVLRGTLHRFRCTTCGHDNRIERPLFYFDFDRRQFLGVWTIDDLPDADLRARELAITFQTVLAEHAPAIVSSHADEFLVRICFGYDELREKLLIDDAGLSDLAVEELKCRVLVADPRFREANVATLWLAQITGDQLRFRPAALGRPAPFPGVAVERAMYDEIAAPGDDAILAARRGLASGPHVSLLRLVGWAHARAG